MNKQTVPEWERRLDALSERISVVEDQNEWLEEQLQERDDRLDAMRDRVAELERRSELLDRVLQNEDSSRKKRAALLLQVLYNDAVSSASGSASMDARAGWENLNRTVDRTTIYDIFETAVDAVDDESVCYIKRESRASNRNTRLILEPEEGPLPDQLSGVPIKGGAD